MKILIVDDIEENLYLLEALLKGSGYEVISSKDGIEALDKLKEEPIDLIISDILMPRMDGFQLCRECKKDNSLKKIPFMFYTATYTDKKDEEFALGLGAEKFILKPQEPEALLKILNEVIEEHKKEMHIAPKELIKEEEIYLTEHNKRLVQKLEKKVLELEKTNKNLQEKEEKIYNLNQFQENIIHNANIWIDVLDEKANVVVWNEAAEKISGYSATEVIGHNKIREWLYPDEKYREKITAKACAIIEKGEVVENFETRIHCKDDKEKIISWYSRNLTNSKGKTIGSVALGRDNTAYKQAIEALKESEEKYRTVFQNTGTATMIIEEDSTSSMINTQCENLIGYSKEEMENKMKWTDFVIPEDLERMKKYHIARRETGEPPPTEYEFRLIDRKGKVKDIFLKIGMIPNTTESVASLTDITKRKQSEMQLQESYQKLEIAMKATIETMSKIVEAKDPYTAGHQQRVSQLATFIAKELTLSHDKIEGIRIASLIHDIGKISLPTEILSKPSKLSELEFSLIKEHAQIGYDILQSIDFSYPIAEIVLQHHEKINGSGYPRELKGDEILLEAKIICVADVVEAMSSHRPYRPALGIDEALEEISQNKGILYDSEVVDVCIKLFKEKGFKL